MTRGVLMDTGPLVAYFCANEARHGWAVEQFSTFTGPVITCEPVLAETCFLMARQNMPPWRLVEKVRDGILRVGLHLDAEVSEIHTLMRRYRNLPMSLADACLVRLSEISELPVCTLDSDFEIYRRHGRDAIPLIMPPKTL